MKCKSNFKVAFTWLLICLCLTFTTNFNAIASQDLSINANNDLSLASISVGSGTESDPYIIGNISDLQFISTNLSAYYKLSNDINLGNALWSPIGTSSAPFTGQIDGNGFTISNFNVTSGDYRGLFGAIKNAKIKNLTLSDFTVSGSSYVGGLSGYTSGTSTTITNCHVENGIVSGTSYVGGMFGKTYDTITIDECSSNANVTSTSSYSSTFIGYAYRAKITNSYAVGNVQGTSYVSGLIGNSYSSSTLINNYVAAIIGGTSSISGIYNGSASLTSCYYNSEISGLSNTTMLYDGRLTAGMTSSSTYSGWDMSRIWNIDEGTSYPYLRSFGKKESVKVSSLNIDGNGTETNPYIITNKNQLNLMKYQLGAYYKLANDINLGGETFVPVGNNSYPFTGQLDGNGYKISNFKSPTTTVNYKGLFGAIKNAVIKDLTLSDFSISGGSYVGGLSGYSDGTTITNCHVENGTISGSSYVGGLFGQAYGTTTINECSSNANVTATSSYSGGLIGYGYTTKIYNSYAVGTIKGSSYVAGLLGNSYSTGTITNCYAATKIIGSSSVSGIYNGSANLTSCYYDSEISGFSNTSTLDIDRLTAGMTSSSNYTGWDMSRIWNIEEGSTYPYLRNLGKTESVKVSSLSIEGSGTEASPYIITNENQLNLIRYQLGAHYKLANDIDLNRKKWTPIGISKPFTGSLDGNGYTISNFRIISNTSYSGLFGKTKDAAIKNITVSDFWINGTSYMGALVASAQGANSTLTNCHVQDGIISGSAYIGGLIGESTDTMTINECSVDAEVIATGSYSGLIQGYSRTTKISNSLALGRIKGNSYVSGLIGNSYNTSTITNCYVGSEIDGLSNVSGLYNGSANATNCYYDAEKSKLINSTSLNTDRLTSAMVSSSNYLTWDFNRTWAIDEGESYPYLRSKGKTPSTNVSNLNLRGKGTEESPYIITNGEQLKLLNYHLTGWFELGEDIDLHNEMWKPIGIKSYSGFIGHFDGKGNTVSNFKMTSTESYSGFFAKTKNAVIKNITLSDFWMNGTSYIGGFVGSAQGTGTIFSNCHIEDGIISGSAYVGGLIGESTDTIAINECSVNAEVVATGSYSGLIQGYGRTCKIENSYAFGTIDGNSYVAGIMGNSYNTSTIKNCYVSAEINGSSNVTGIYNGSANVTNCYYDAEKAKLPNTTTLDIDRLTSAMVSSANYKDWNFNDIWAIDEGHSYPYLRSVAKPDSVNVGSLSIEGMGTETNPYIITNKEQFQLMKYHTSAWYKLANDIDVQGMEWTPIASDKAPFKGHLDGGNHTVSNFYINNTSNKNTGFFAATNNANIMNFKLDNFQVTGSDYTGGLIGNATGTSSKLKNCHLSKAVITGVSYVGGIAGSYNGSMSSCTFSGIINASGSYCGGAAGYAPSGTIFDECKIVINTPNNITGITGNNISSGNSTFTKITGTGTKSDPYVVVSGDGFIFIRDYPGADYVIGGNINGGGTTIYPIGTPSRPFTGYINGNGYTISNVHISGGSGGYGGLLGYVSGGGIGHITISNSVIDGGDSEYTGGLVGFDDGESIVFEDCHIKDTVINANNYVGSLIGGSTGMVVMKDCSSNAEINAEGNYIGGLVGSCNVQMERCKFRGTINAKGDYVGGLAAYINKGSFEESYSSASLTGRNYVGGLIGAKGNSDVSILNCYATGSIKGTSYLGGLVGYSIGTTNAKNAYAAMKMEGTSNIGGLESRNTNISTTNCYYDNSIYAFAKDTTNARPTTEMVTKSNFIDWNFNGLWKIVEGVTYPYFDEMEYPGGAAIRNLSASGKLVGATTGSPIGGLKINVRDGLDAKTGPIVNTLQSGQDGTFTIDSLGKGDYTLEIIGEGYITTYHNFTCVEGESSLGNIPVMPVMKNNTMSIVLSWGNNPKDLDSYLTGGSKDIYYGNKTGTGVSLDTDCTSAYGPETTTIDFSKIPKGTYKYYVNWFSSGTIAWGSSNATVKVYMNGTLVKQYTVPSSLTSKAWNVFSIDTATQTIKDL